MKLYNVVIAATDEELCVVARTSNHAAEVLVTFWLARTGTAPGEFTVIKGPPAFVDASMVEAAAHRDVAGVIIRQADGSVIFDPAIGG